MRERKIRRGKAKKKKAISIKKKLSGKAEYNHVEFP